MSDIFLLKTMIKCCIEVIISNERFSNGKIFEELFRSQKINRFGSEYLGTILVDSINIDILSACIINSFVIEHFFDFLVYCAI